MAALPIRDDIAAAELRRRARRERDGRVSARLIAIANALDGMDRASFAAGGRTLCDWFTATPAEGIADATGPNQARSEVQLVPKLSPILLASSC